MLEYCFHISPEHVFCVHKTVSIWRRLKESLWHPGIYFHGRCQGRWCLFISFFLFWEAHLFQELHSVPQALHLLRHVLRQAEASSCRGEGGGGEQRLALDPGHFDQKTRCKRRRSGSKPGGAVPLGLISQRRTPFDSAARPSSIPRPGKIHGRGHVPKVQTGGVERKIKGT